MTTQKDRIIRAVSEMMNQGAALLARAEQAEKQAEAFKQAADIQADIIRGLERDVEKLRYALLIAREETRAAEKRYNDATSPV